MGPDERAVDDPQLRQAVLDLFRANQDLRAAYTDYSRSHGRDLRVIEALASAEARVDEAREKVVDVQARVWPSNE